MSDVLPRPSPDVVSRFVGDEMVLVNLGTSQILTLNPTGARFWELLAAGNSRGEIEATLLSEYDVSTDEVAASIDALLAELESEGLVETGETG